MGAESWDVGRKGGGGGGLETSQGAGLPSRISRGERWNSAFAPSPPPQKNTFNSSSPAQAPPPGRLQPCYSPAPAALWPGPISYHPTEKINPKGYATGTGSARKNKNPSSNLPARPPRVLRGKKLFLKQPGGAKKPSFGR